MDTSQLLLFDDGRFPNSRLPVLLYRDAVPGAALEIEALFRRNGWSSSWRDGIYDFHHYHSTAHEALGVFAGSATVQLGGEAGPSLELRRGDAVVIPAGVAHRRLHSSLDFRVVGAYPAGQTPDLRYGREGERPAVDRAVASVALPQVDPVAGARGPLVGCWTAG